MHNSTIWTTLAPIKDGGPRWRRPRLWPNMASSKTAAQDDGPGFKIVGNGQEKVYSEKKLTIQKPRWEKTKLPIRYLNHEDIS